MMRGSKLGYVLTLFLSIKTTAQQICSFRSTTMQTPIPALLKYTPGKCCPITWSPDFIYFLNKRNPNMLYRSAHISISCLCKLHRENTRIKEQ